MLRIGVGSEGKRGIYGDGAREAIGVPVGVGVNFTCQSRHFHKNTPRS